MNKKAVESLIKSGAMDCLCSNRAAHMGIYESLMDSAQASARNNIAGQISLFQINAEELDRTGTRELPDIRNFRSEELLSQEKEMLGVYLTAHPLDDYAELIQRNVSVTSRDLAEVLASEEEGYTGSVQDGMKAVMAGIILSKKNLITKNGKMMAFVNMEDMYGALEVVVFPNVYERCSELIEEDKIISVKGTINFKEGEMPKLLADEIVSIRELGAARREPDAVRAAEPPGRAKPSREQPEGIVKIRLPEGDGIHNIDRQNSLILDKITRIMKKYPGKHQAIIYYPQGGSRRTGRELWVEPGEAFAAEITEIVGQGNYKQ